MNAELAEIAEKTIHCVFCGLCVDRRRRRRRDVYTLVAMYFLIAAPPPGWNDSMVAELIA